MAENSRRKFLLQTAQAAGVATVGGLVWSSYLGEAKASPLTLRPPGAVPEDEFLSKCIRCGLCVEACPYDTLILAKAGDNKPIGTPYFIPRDIPCYMCEDIPCVPVCPSGALDEKLVQTDGQLNIEKSKMGTAMVDVHSCVAYWGIQCDACYRACPILDSAIKLNYKRNERTGKHAYLIPEVDPDACTGCGLCEHACITKKPAIYVLPQEVARGENDTNYVKGWDKQDEVRLENAEGGQINETGITAESGEDYLNDMELEFDDE
jgi:ferredoxin-type protein NapG